MQRRHILKNSYAKRKLRIMERSMEWLVNGDDDSVHGLGIHTRVTLQNDTLKMLEKCEE